MENRDEEFEKYLREFQPRRPRALPDRVWSDRAWRFAAATVAVIGIASFLWRGVEKRASDRSETAVHRMGRASVEPAEQPLKLVGMTRMALNDPQALDARLEEASRQMLPDFRSSTSTLRVLAKQ